MERKQQALIEQDLHKKMVFLVGPRQAGKTYLAKTIAGNYQRPLYLNYDSNKDRKIILDESWLKETDLLIFDELHKMPQWKNYIKGVYDTKPNNRHVLITGSARLEVYADIGDSLAGRYFTHHLLPLSLAELKQTNQTPDLQRLLVRSGFPEPYLASSDTEAERWRAQYSDSLIRTDVLDFDKISDLRAMQLLFQLLRSRVGSPVSYQSLARDVSLSPTTVKKYIEILEALYIVFRITPYSKNIARSLLKEPKLYFFDTGLVLGNDDAKLENLVAVSLLKSCYAQRDYAAQSATLHYLRTKDGKEVDFALCKQNEIELLIEVKLSSSAADKNIRYFYEKYQLPATQLVMNLKHEHQDKGVIIRNVNLFLQELTL